MTILIVGGTGLVGGQIALALQRQNAPVRALVRGGSASVKAGALRSAGVQIIDGDLTRPESLAAACEGIEAVVCTATSMPTGADDGLRRVDHDGVLALIDAAERAGVKKFVYTSYSGHLWRDSALQAAKRDCEARLLQSAMDAVILRPTYFMEVWLGPHLGVDPINGAVRIIGTGEAKISYISLSNVAEFAVSAVRKRTGKHAILEMGGPEPLSQLDAVRTLERALGTSCRLEFVPVEALQQQYRSPDPLQRTFAALMLGCADGDVIPGAAALAQDYGVVLRSVAEYAAMLGPTSSARPAKTEAGISAAERGRS
jgi:uncharacterized protein YbjT (DUF2867 family)